MMYQQNKIKVSREIQSLSLWGLAGCLFFILVYVPPSFSQGKKEVLTIEPAENNPRNSEGDFIVLKDGRILFVYSHYYGESSSDHATAYLAGRFSPDGGKSWSQEDTLILPNEGDMNVMSVSLLRLNDGQIAMFYLRKNSTSDCIPMMRISKDKKRAALRTPLNVAISKDEGRSWEHIKTLENDPDSWYCYTAIDFVDDHILLGHCAGNRPKGTGLSVTQITGLDQDWLYQ